MFSFYKGYVDKSNKRNTLNTPLDSSNKYTFRYTNNASESHTPYGNSDCGSNATYTDNMPNGTKCFFLYEDILAKSKKNNTSSSTLGASRKHNMNIVYRDVQRFRPT